MAPTKSSTPAANIPQSIDLNSNYADIILVQNGRFSIFSAQQITDFKQKFKSVDANGDSFLDHNELAKMFEKMGETKTFVQVKQLIASVDADGDGKISFMEYLELLSDPVQQPNEQEQHNADATPKRTIQKIDSVSKFEMAAMETVDKTAANRDQIKKDYEERKRVAELKKNVAEQEKAEEEAKLREAQERKSRLAAKAAMFEK